MTNARLAVHLDVNRIAAIADTLNATDGMVRSAVRIAARKASLAAQKMTTDKARSELGMSPALIRRRLRALSSNSRARNARSLRGRSRIWLGLNPVDPMDLTPKPRQTSTGVVAGGQLFPGAFIAKDAHGSLRVFKRRKATRLPLDREFLDVYDQGVAMMGTDIFPLIADIFYDTFNKELELEIRLWKKYK